MKIAIMMRAMDKEAGFRALTQGLVASMLKLAPDDSFLLIHQTPKWIGEFAAYPNATAVLAPVSPYLLWDQVAVPWVAWRGRADVIFNPKFFVPLISPCPVTMGLQEPSWFTRPLEYDRWTRWYQKLMIPLSIRKCAHVFPNSRFILEENRLVLRMPIEHATIQYSAADERFCPVGDTAALENYRSQHKLPAKFILVVSRAVHPGTGDIFAGKSPEVAYRAFARIRDRIPHEIIFAGRGIRRYLEHTEGPNADFSRVRFLDFVPYEELHLMYNLAEVFVNPCVYEGCPNTVLQAMACGCPTIVAAAGGSADVAAGAALMAKPMDDIDMSQKMLAVASDAATQKELRARSLARSRYFTWDKTAAITLDALRRLVRKQ
jgi:glycosyltransferase involved in cell wall biosynthesis